MYLVVMLALGLVDRFAISFIHQNQ